MRRQQSFIAETDDGLPTYPNIDQTAIIGHAPEDSAWQRFGTPGWSADSDKQFFIPRIHADVRIEAFVTVDSGTVRHTEIGAGSWLFKHAHVGHDARIGRYVIVTTHAIIGGHAEIGDGAKIGLGAIILPFRHVGTGATVGAGAVVTRNVPNDATVVGNPARMLPKDERNDQLFSERMGVAAFAQ